MPRTIAITNMTGFRNKGCEALVKTLLPHLVHGKPDARIRIFTDDPSYDPYFLANVSCFDRLSNIVFERTPDARGGVAAYARRFATCDAIISIGGDIFSSEYGDLDRHLAPIRAAGLLRKRTFLLGHSVGPFKTHGEAKRFSQAAARVETIAAREWQTYTYLSNLDPGPRIVRTADPAFLLDAADPGPLEQQYPALSGKKLVCLALSQGISQYAGLNDQDHVWHMKMLVEHLRRRGYHVVLLPHVMESAATNDDALFCRKVYDDLGDKRDVTLIAAHHHAEELKTIIGRCECVISERLHPGIAALAQSIPTFLFSYSVKSRGVLHDFFGMDYADYMVPISHLDLDYFVERVDAFIGSLDDARQVIARALPGVIARAERNFEFLPL